MLYWLKKILGLRRSVNAGERGERAAEAWLVRERGFAIVARNWRNPHDRRDELDLVCRDGEILVFVEVKARAPGALVRGFHAIDARKRRVLRRTITAYLRSLGTKPRTFRFDVVEVSTDFAGGGRLVGDGVDRATAPPFARSGVAAPAESGVLHFENVELFSKHFRP